MKDKIEPVVNYTQQRDYLRGRAGIAPCILTSDSRRGGLGGIPLLFSTVWGSEANVELPYFISKRASSVASQL